MVSKTDQVLNLFGQITMERETFNTWTSMKKVNSFMLSIVAVAAFASCQKEQAFEKEQATGEMVEMTMVVGQDTKTELSEDNVVWSDGDKITVFQTTKDSEEKYSVLKSVSNGGVKDELKMTFGFSFAQSDNSYFVYDAVYPSTAAPSSAPASVADVNLTTPATQYPTSTSFDSSADLLLAKSSEVFTTQPTVLDGIRFKRMVSVGQMTIKKLGSSEDITKVSFSASNGEQPIALAGKTSYNLSTGEVVSAYGDESSDYTLTLDYTGKGTKANESMVVYFMSYPFSLGDGDKFTVVVETATQSFTKEVVLSGRTLELPVGNGAKFSVNMTGVEGVAKGVALDYACFTKDDYATTSPSGSYANFELTKSHGDKWSGFACLQNSLIGIRKDSDANNDSYIKLPDFEKNIETVIVTLGEKLSGESTFTLETTATGRDGSIASVDVNGTDVQYTFDLSELTTPVKTAYFRSTGYQAKIEKIEAICVEDSRDQIGAPETVNAAVGAEEVNKITVSWTSVTDAKGYEVSLTSSNDVVSQVVASNIAEYSFVGLAYETEYTASVIALADQYVGKNSDSKSANPVSTGEEPQASDTDNIYTLWEEDGAFVDGTNYVLAIKDGADGTYYFITNNGTSDNLLKNANLTDITLSGNKITNPNAKYVFTAETSETTGCFTLKNGGKYIYNNGSNTTLNTNGTSSAAWLPTYLTNSKTYKLNLSSASGRYIGAASTTKVGGYANSNFKDQVANSTAVAQCAGAISVFKQTQIAAVHATEVKLDCEGEFNMVVNGEKTITATIIPDDAVETTVTWTSSNEDVVIVENGVVTAKSKGDATITAKTSNNIEANCTIHVVDPIAVTGIEIQLGGSPVSAHTIWKEESVTLTAVVSPDNATNKEVIWSSSDEDIATVDGGTVTAKTTAGTTIITAKSAENETIIATCDVTVKTTIANTQETAYTVAEAKAIIDAGKDLTTTQVYVKGIVSQVDSYNSTYNSVTYWISEDGATTNQFEVYSGKNLNNTNFSSKDDVEVGADVIIYGYIKKFNSTYEFDKNNYLVSYKVEDKPISNFIKTANVIADKDAQLNVKEYLYLPDTYSASLSISVKSGVADNVSISSPNVTFLAAGEYTLTITAPAVAGLCAETSGEIKFTVKDAVLESVTIGGTLAKTSYSVGDTFDRTGLTLTANYSDGSHVDVTNDSNTTWETDPETFTEVVTSVYVLADYKGVQADKSFDVTVSAAIKGLPVSFTGSTMSVVTEAGTATITNSKNGNAHNQQNMAASNGDYWLFTVPVQNLKSGDKVNIEFSGIKNNKDASKGTYTFYYYSSVSNSEKQFATYEETTTASKKDFTLTMDHNINDGTLYIKMKMTSGGATSAGNHYLGDVTISVAN